jgi:hypothetical protein
MSSTEIGQEGSIRTDGSLNLKAWKVKIPRIYVEAIES